MRSDPGEKFLRPCSFRLRQTCFRGSEFGTRVHTLKTTIIATTVATAAVISMCVADSAVTLPKTDSRPAGTLQEVHAEVQKTRADLRQALNRIEALEKQVNSLQQANAKLAKAIQEFGQPRLVPLERK
jgi:septal ring factor EnvC (AmiA/AmiB activator)